MLTVIRHGAALLIIVKTWRLASNDRLLRAMPVTALGYLSVNILNSGRSGRLVRVCAEFQSIGLANRFELVYLDKPGVTIYGWGKPGTDARAWAISGA